MEISDKQIKDFSENNINSHEMEQYGNYRSIVPLFRALKCLDTYTLTFTDSKTCPGCEYSTKELKKIGSLFCLSSADVRDKSVEYSLTQYLTRLQKAIVNSVKFPSLIDYNSP